MRAHRAVEEVTAPLSRCAGKGGHGSRGVRAFRAVEGAKAQWSYCAGREEGGVKQGGGRVNHR